MARTQTVKGKDLIDQILDAVEVKGLSREEVLGQGGLLKQLTGRLLNKILEAEMDEHLGYEKNSNAAKQDGKGCIKSVYVALGVNFESKKDVLGLWIAETEGAKFWMGVLNELKNRGVEDILIACMDGLTGFPDAVKAVFPQTHVQLCIVHMIRNSTKFVSYKDLRKLCADLKEVYSALTEEAALDALDGFGKIWNSRYPMIQQSWQNHWNDLCEFFKYPMRNPQGYLHHECHRVPELPVTESDAEPLDICER